MHSQLYRLPLLGKGDLDSLSTRLLLPPLRDGDRLSRRGALRGGVTERDIDLVRLRPLGLSLPFLLGGVLDMERDLGGSLLRFSRPTLARESARARIDLDLERECPRLDRDLDRLGRLNLGRDTERDGERDSERDGERDLDRDLDLDNESLRPRLGDLE